MPSPVRIQKKARIDKEFMDNVLHKAQEIYVAFHVTNHAPYVLPLNFIYLQDKIYIHCAQEGRKIDCIQANPYIGFTAVTDITIIKEKSTTYYSSVCGTGKATLVDDIEEKETALQALATRYAATCPCPTPPASLAHVAIIRIDIEELCGKSNPAPQQ